MGQEISVWQISGSLFSFQSIVALLLLSATLILTIINTLPVKEKKIRYTIISIKTVTILLLLAFVLNPVKITKKIALRPMHGAFLIDDTASMNLNNGKGKPRRAAFFKIWDTLLNHKKLHFKLFDLDMKLHKNSKEIVFKRKKSNLIKSVSSFLENADSDWDYSIFYTDMQDNSNFVDADSIYKLESLLKTGAGRHLIVVSSGSVSNAPDLGIKKATFDPIAFYKNISTVVLLIKGANLSQKVNVKIQAGVNGKWLKKEIITLDKNLESKWTFQYRPEKTGTEYLMFKCTILKPETKEINLKNNTLFVRQKVIRDRIRVLHLAGHPSWDVKSLRNFLKTEENIDLISFYIMVRSSSYFYTDLSRTVLIPFPTKRLFVDELNGFDLIIFQNFRFGAFDTDRYANKIVDFVKKGGACLIVGGEQIYLSPQLYTTSLQKLFPSKVTPKTTLKNMFNLGMFSPKVTTTGMFHPLILSMTLSQSSEELFKNVPNIEGTNVQEQLKQGASILIKTNPKDYPLLTVRKMGMGRTAFISTDSLWTWKYDSNKNSSSRIAYNKLIGSVIRWLLKDPDITGVSINLTNGKPEPEKSTLIIPSVPGKSIPEIKWDITSRSIASGKSKHVAKLKNGYVWKPEHEGVFMLNATGSWQNNKVNGKKLVLVTEDRRENIEPGAQAQLFKKILSEQGIPIISSQKVKQVVSERIKKDIKEVNTKKPLLHPIFLLLALFLLGLEWYLRSGYA